jgi:hypothetical protein
LFALEFLIGVEKKFWEQNKYLTIVNNVNLSLYAHVILRNASVLVTFSLIKNCQVLSGLRASLDCLNILMLKSNAIGGGGGGGFSGGEWVVVTFL